MLRRCLDHVQKMAKVQDAFIEPIVIVVDNDPEASASAIVGEMGRAAFYIHEPRRGITWARNSAVETALAVNADFIAFIDDDAWPTDSWLSNMIYTQRETGADIVRGRTTLVYPDPLPYWIIPKKKRTGSRESGDAFPVNPRFIAAGNVLISSKLVRDWGLRFDHRFALCSGEDTEFFTRATRRGASCIASNLPVMYEEVISERCTYWRQIRRQYQFATGNTIVDIDEGKILTILSGIAGNATRGLWLAVLAMLAAPFSQNYSKKCLIKSGKKVMYGAGQIASLIGFNYQAYLKTDGY
jgi:succinoglycan biosynthesis protein ExoM